MNKNIKTGIYKITNIINQKVYIGQSKNIYRRWYQHKADSKTKNTPLYIEMRKYGLENFEFEILEECKINKLTFLEDYWIKEYNSYVPYGYNISKPETHGTSLSIPKKYLDIIEELKNTNNTYQVIGNKYNLSKQQIARINSGAAWKIDNIDYPIRKKIVLEIEPLCDMIKQNFSLKDISIILNTTIPTIKNFLYSNNIKVEDLRKSFTSNKKVLMLDENYEEINNFTSITAAATFLKQTLNEDIQIKSYVIAISRHLKNGKPYRGYYWKEQNILERIEI